MNKSFGRIDKIYSMLKEVPRPIKSCSLSESCVDVHESGAILMYLVEVFPSIIPRIGIQLKVRPEVTRLE